MIYALERNVHRHEVHLDSPLPHYGTRLEKFTISGWAPPAVTSVMIGGTDGLVEIVRTEPRPDVTAYLRSVGASCTHDIHGFTIEVPAGTYEVYAVDQDGDQKLQSSVIFNKDETVVFGGGKWLFLNDSNRVQEQAEGTIDGRDIILVWDSYLDKITDLSNRLGFEWCYSIAPSKELIVPELSPFSVSDNNLLNQFIRKSRYGHKYVCSIDELRDLANISYWPGDTHWTSVGGAISSKDVLRHFNIENDINPLKPVEFHMQPGDLGLKLRGLYEAPYAHLVYQKSVRKIYEAYAPGGNTGQLMIYESDEEAAKGTLLVSGGSSFAYMHRFLAPWFKRTYFLHGTGRIDPALVEEIKPTHVLLQNNSRFMISHRDNGEFCTMGDLIDVTKLAGAGPSGVKAYDDVVSARTSGPH